MCIRDSWYRSFSRLQEVSGNLKQREEKRSLKQHIHLIVSRAWRRLTLNAIWDTLRKQHITPYMASLHPTLGFILFLSLPFLSATPRAVGLLAHFFAISDCWWYGDTSQTPLPVEIIYLHSTVAIHYDYQIFSSQQETANSCWSYVCYSIAAAARNGAWVSGRLSCSAVFASAIPVPF